MQEFFKSDNTKDTLCVILIKKPHKAIFKLIHIDNVDEHINLISKLNNHLKLNDIKWVEIILDFVPIIPANTISYTNKYNGNFVCHIEDFERFYFANCGKIIKIEHVYCSNKTSFDGWTKVIGIKKEKKDKYDMIVKTMDLLVGDWNSP